MKIDIREYTFYDFYEERIDRMTDELRKVNIMDFCTLEVWNDIAAELYQVFHSVAVRTLIVELHIYKDKGLLQGRTAEEEYYSYCRCLRNEDYRIKIYEKYPGLFKYLGVLEKNQYAFWQQFLQHLMIDWKRIKESFYINPESLVMSVKRCDSDFHCNGKSVVVIETNRGERFLYKPHTLANEVFLQEFMAYIYNALGLSNFSFPMIDKDNYGWVKEIAYQECRNREEVVFFYRRTGILVAVSYILGIGDLHYQNIIAHGEYPVIIDAETLFQHMDDLYQWTEKTSDYYSVLSSGVFPGGVADKNVAGITGGASVKYGKKIPIILDDRTSDIRVGYRMPWIKEGKNRILCNNEKVDYYDFKDEILKGFSDAYEWFLNNKSSIRRGIANIASKLYCRWISGSTQYFALILSASSHPDLQRDMSRRMRYINSIFRGRSLGEWEAKAIENGDIPWFGRNLDDRHLYTDQGIIYRDYFEETITERLQKRMGQISDEDCTLQKKTLQLSMELFGEGSLSGEDSNCVNRVDKKIINVDWMGYAEYIAEYIVDNMVCKRGKIFWLGIEGEKESIKIKPMDIYFYSGIAGMAVFFRKVYQECCKYRDICEILEEMLFSYTDRILQKEITPISEYSGMYCGEGSIIYSYQLLYKITGDGIYCDYASKHSEILFKCIEQEKNLDLLYGNAGAVWVLCQQYIDTNNKMYLEKAYKALEYIERRRIGNEQRVSWFKEAKGNPVCSAAHGNSGMLMAYARIQSLNPDTDFYDRMSQIIMYEDQFYDDRHKNWADMRKTGDEKWETYSWCNGGVGIMAVRTYIFKWFSKTFRLEKDKIRQFMMNIPFVRDMCLCHGNMGNYLVFLYVASVLKDDEVCKRGEYMRNEMASFLWNKREAVLKQLSCQMGFMGGIAGIGMGCMIMENSENYCFRVE